MLKVVDKCVKKGYNKNIIKHKKKEIQTMEKINMGLTKKDIFNAQAGKGFKEAAKEAVTGMLKGFAVTEVEDIDYSTGELKGNKTVCVMKVEGMIYSGESIVVARRLTEMANMFTEEEICAGIEIQFTEIKAGRGTATNFMLV